MKRAFFFLVTLVVVMGISCNKEDLPAAEAYQKAVDIANAVISDSVMPHVYRLSALHLQDNPVDNTGFPAMELFPSGNLTRDLAVGYVAGQLASMGYHTDTVVLGNAGLKAYNVVAEKVGTLFPDEYILLGAHLDAFYGAADDNTSGVAALLEVARAVQGFSFERTIRFVAFDLEEFGSIGSTRYFEAGYDEGLKAAIVLDAIGYASPEPGSQKNTIITNLPDVGDYMITIGNKKAEIMLEGALHLGNHYQLAKTAGIIPPGTGDSFFASLFARSDHGLLWYRDLPALFFTDGANLRNPHYHLATDLPETLDPQFLQNNTKLIAAVTALLADYKF